MPNRPWLRLIAALLCALTWAACSDPPEVPPEDGTISADGGASDGSDLPGDTTSVAVDTAPFDPFACPGGHDCSCAQHSDCLSGLCVDLGEGKRCAEPCERRDCAGDRVCRRVVEGGKGGWICVPPRVNLCNPCKASSECVEVGLGDSVCVDYGDRGAFCGAACRGDADCGEGFACQTVHAVEGGTSLQCVKIDDLGLPTDCPCSAAAVNAGLETLCRKSGSGASCLGKRTCSATGLSACTAESPTPETCDGADNDCDGQTDEDSCIDGNPCTDDSCQGRVGCINAHNTAPCDADGSVCTAGDACSEGSCKAGAALVCDDGNPCTKDSCDAAKGCQSPPDDGAACDADGNACSVGDSCKAGACTVGTAKDCDDGKPCTLDGCDPKTGACSNQLTEALSCDDGNPCTSTDLCDAKGSCAGTPLACDDGNPCTKGSCDPQVGCTSEAVAAGAACDDGNLCTDIGTCAGGVCQAGKAKVCTSGKACVASRCNGKTGQCVEQPAKIGASCDDGDPCTSFDGCTAKGTCVGKGASCDDGNACTKDSCDAKGCKNEVLSGPCDDGDACTEGEACSGTGQAVTCGGGKTKDCDDKNPCTDDSCDASKGCVNAALKDGTSCDDGDACTKPDQCVGGTCKAGPDTCSCAKDADCDDNNPCTTDNCGTGSKCANIALTDGAACDDGDPCTEKDTCKAGGGSSTCTPGSKKDCDDNNPCTTDTCEAGKGCQTAAVKDGTSCNDGDACTDNDSCKSGSCSGDPKSAGVAVLAGAGQGFKDGKGTSAQFNVPSGVARGSEGTLYVADTQNHRLRKLTSDGTASTLAGSALPGQANGTGGSASFNNPTGVAIDGDGNLYVADRDNHLIRKVTAAGVVTTLAGSNTPGGFGQPLQGGYVDATGTAAKFNQPTAIVFSGGALYVADAANHRIRKVTLTGVVTTVAGSGTAGFKDDKGTAAQFNTPGGIAADSAGILYVGDTQNHRVRRVAVDGTVTTLAGSGTAAFKDGKGTAAQFNQPMGIAIDGLGQLLVCDSGNHRIRTVKTDGTTSVYVGSGEQDYADGELTKAKLDQPSAIVTDGKGNAFIMDRGNHRVRTVTDGPKLCLINASPS